MQKIRSRPQNIQLFPVTRMLSKICKRNPLCDILNARIHPAFMFIAGEYRERVGMAVAKGKRVTAAK